MFKFLAADRQTDGPKTIIPQIFDYWDIKDVVIISSVNTLVSNIARFNKTTDKSIPICPSNDTKTHPCYLTKMLNLLPYFVLHFVFFRKYAPTEVKKYFLKY